MTSQQGGSRLPRLRLGLRRRPLRRLILFTLLVIAAAAVAATLMLRWSEDESVIHDLGFETAKFTIQLLLIALVGGLVVKEFDRLRERKTAVHDFRRQVLRKLIQAYSDTKKVRRVLRAKCVILKPSGAAEAADGAVGMPAAAYDEYLAHINTTQIELEVISREVKVFKDTIGRSDDLTRHIDSMESYLKSLISEYEKQRRKYGDATCCPLAQLQCLQRFLGKRAAGDFYPGFGLHFHNALTLLQEQRLGLG